MHNAVVATVYYQQIVETTFIGFKYYKYLIFTKSPYDKFSMVVLTINYWSMQYLYYIHVVTAGDFLGHGTTYAQHDCLNNTVCGR